jgi:hypothetical protein
MALAAHSVDYLPAGFGIALDPIKCLVWQQLHAQLQVLQLLNQSHQQNRSPSDANFNADYIPE